MNELPEMPIGKLRQYLHSEIANKRAEAKRLEGEIYALESILALIGERPTAAD